MKTRYLLIPLICIASLASASDAPAVAIASDGYPTGSGTPEGAACDLVRAFITSDVDLLKATCIKRYPPSDARFNEFLAMIIRGTEEDKRRKKPHPKNPAAIVKVFAARHLSLNGPSSYGYAVLDLQDVMFVDVLAQLHDKSYFVNRTMVVKTAKGIWRVHPCPTIDPLLSAGLNDESDSTIEWQNQATRKPDVEPVATDNPVAAR
jgi:hypothetical protein